MNLIEKILVQKPQYEMFHIDLGDDEIEIPVRDDVSNVELQGVISELINYCFEDGMFKQSLFEVSFPIVYFSVACPQLVMDGDSSQDINVAEMNTVFARLDLPTSLPSSAYACYFNAYELCLESLKEFNKQRVMKQILELGELIQTARDLFESGKEAFINILDSDDFQDTVKSLLESNLKQ